MIELKSVDELESLIEKSNEQPVLFFKHSIRCGTSHYALDKMRQQLQQAPDQLLFVYVDLINFRNISNEIAARLRVPHQSPQAILVRNGKVLYQASHLSIEVDDIRNELSV